MGEQKKRLILYHNFDLRYAILMNFGRNSTSIALLIQICII